jgi:hypothetical protein
MDTETFRSGQAAIKTGHTEDVRWSDPRVSDLEAPSPPFDIVKPGNLLAKQ